MRVAVIGGGIVGVSAGRFLAARGHAVTLYEQHGMFHDRGSSHGQSRIVRRAYPDAFYTACMAEAYPMWGDLEAACGVKLVDECGLLYFGDRDAPRIRAVVDALESLGLWHDVLDSAGVTVHLPSLRLKADEVGVFTPEAGWVDAAAVLRASFGLARDHGMQVREEAASLAALEPDFDAVVVAGGAWVREFVPVDVTVTLQTFGYAGPTQRGPVWIDDSSLAYGIPGDPLGHKIGAHQPGPAIDPSVGSREPVVDHIAQIKETARRRFGRDGSLANVKTCLYTSTPDEDFRIGRIGTKGVFASACSGHGFKLGPWVGRLLADIVEGKDAPENHPRFVWPRPE